MREIRKTFDFPIYASCELTGDRCTFAAERVGVRFPSVLLLMTQPRFEHEDVPELIRRRTLFRRNLEPVESGARVYPSFTIENRRLQRFSQCVAPAANEPAPDRNSEPA